MQIIWDEDHDERIYEFIETFVKPRKLEQFIHSIGERSGYVQIIWYNNIPQGFEENKNFELPSGDIWYVWSAMIYLQEPIRNIDMNTRYNILKEQRWKCNNCGEHLKFRKDSQFGNKIAHIDHIHPFSEMYTYRKGFININERSNLQALCEDCNKKKHKNKQ